MLLLPWPIKSIFSAYNHGPSPLKTARLSQTFTGLSSFALSLLDHLRYSACQLIKLRRQSCTLSSATIFILKQNNIFRFRGKRSGWKKISTRITSRFDRVGYTIILENILCSWHLRPVNLDDLISISIAPNSSQLSPCFSCTLLALGL